MDGDVDLVLRHDRGARRLPPQSGHRLTAHRRRHALHGDEQRRGRGTRQHPVSVLPQLHRARQEHRRAGKWESVVVGENILHGSWTNPAYGVFGGRAQVVFPGGNGVIYSLDADTGEVVWEFDMNPKDSEWILGGRGTRNNVLSTPVVYATACISASARIPSTVRRRGTSTPSTRTGTGDVTDTHVVWHRGGDDFYRTMSTGGDPGRHRLHLEPVGVPPRARRRHRRGALDVRTPLPPSGAHRSSPTARCIWATRTATSRCSGPAREMELISEQNLGASVYSTPVVKDGIMYILTRNRLVGAPGRGPGRAIRLVGSREETRT